MRTGGCTLQQTLTVEAASVLKHSLSLARRRGHAQVTPLHVAATLLTLRSSLLRRACLKSQLQLLPHHQSTSHHHPLQCRALELCFNVALNRLPTTPAGPLLHGQPSLSNALIAALKRAQAHQRRGCIEQQQQQPLLTIKVELEQLVISILDDPSVSRVMREAGFSSTAVKTHIEDSTTTSSVFQCYTSSGGVFSSPCSPSPPETQREIITTNFWPTHLSNYSSERNPITFSPQKKVFSSNSLCSPKQDIKQVLDVLLGAKKKNIVIVGDSVSVTEGLLTELMGILERGEVPSELKQTHFIKFNFEAVLPLRFMKREDVEMKVSELKRKVDSVSSGCGAIIYVGDLKWTVVEDEISGSSQVEHLVGEIGRLVTKYNNNSNTKVWLMGTASYQTYMRCQMRQPPLEIQWALQVVSVPSAGLGLSLHAAASSAHETKPFVGKQDQDNLICCAECTSNYEREAQIKSNSNSPPWLQAHCGIVNIQKNELAELRGKWSRFCHSVHQGTLNQNHLRSTFRNSQDSLSNGKTYSYVSSSAWWQSQDSTSRQHSDSMSFTDFDSRPNNKNCNHNVHKFRRQLSCEFDFSQNPSLDSLRNSQRKDGKITLALGNPFLCDSGKLEKQQIEMRKLLQENVPWQSETISSIVEALIESKSLRRNILLLFQGNDTIGKRRLAMGISESMFGSTDFVLHINMRKADNEATPFCEMLSRALRNRVRVVVLVEDADLADTQFMKFLADGFESGNFGELSESVFILAAGDSMSIEDKKINQESVIGMGLRFIERKPNYWIPNLESKRKAEWDFTNKAKSPRIEEKNDEFASSKKDLPRQSSFNSLDLNIKANEEDDEGEGNCDEVSTISSDITRETTTLVHTPDGFFKSIDKCFVLNYSAARDQEAKEAFLSKMKGCFKEVLGGQNVMGFSVEERVLEELVLKSGTFLNSLFDNWVKDIFQTSLQTLLKTGGKGGTATGEIRVCFEGLRGKIQEEGYTGICLPKNIQFSF